MKKLGIIFLSLIMVISSVAPTLVSFASENVVTPVSVKFYKDSTELSVIETGDIAPEVVINASAAGDIINIYYAMYDTSDNTLLNIVIPSAYTLAKGMNTIDNIPAITVDSVDNRELKVFAWGSNISPVDKYKCLGTVSAAGIGSLSYTDATGTHTSAPDSNDNIKFTTEYVKGSYTNTTYPTTITPTAANGTYKTADGETTIDLTDGKTTILSDDNGATRDYTVSADNKVVQFASDFNDSGSVGSAPAVSSSDKGSVNKYGSDKSNIATIQYRPVSGSDEVDTSDKVIKFYKESSYFTYYIQPYGNSEAPRMYDVMEMKFDFRYDDPAAKGLIINQGFKSETDTAQANLDIIVGNATGNSWWKSDGFGSGEYGIGLTETGSKLAVGVPGANGSGYMKLKAKQWYTVKYVSRIDRVNGDYYVDLYIDDMNTPALTVKNGKTTGTPSGYITGKSLDGNDAYNAYFRMQSDCGGTAYVDNMSISYSYSSENPDLFIIGDSIAASYSYAESAVATSKQGWGKYIIENYIDNSKITAHNLAYPGHRAKWMVEGGDSAKTQGMDADWQHIKGQVGKDDYVIISIGVNDRPNTSLADIETYATTMANEAKARGAKVIIVSEPPLANATVTAIETISGEEDGKEAGRLNNAATAAAVPYIDLHAELTTRFNAKVEGGEVLTDYYMSDRRHFTDKGAKYVADTLAELINASEDTDLKDYFKSAN